MKKKILVVLSLTLLLSLLLFGCSFMPTKPGNGTDNTDNGATALKKAGTYKIGQDLDAGEYLLITDKQSDDALSSAYYQVTLTPNAKPASADFLYNDNFYYRSYIAVEDGQYLQFTSCKLYSIDEYPAVDKNAAGWHAGQYKVGVDLDAGEYKLTTLKNDSILDNGYYALTKTPNAKIGTSDFIGNKNFENQVYITLTADTYVEFSNATLTKA